MKYIVSSIPAHRSMLEVYFWIYPNALTRFGTRESKENCSVFPKTVFLIGFKGYYWMGKNLTGFLLKLEFHRGPFLDLCCFSYILTICLMVSIRLLNCLPIIYCFFSIVQDLNESVKYLNLDLSVISQLAYHWKMFFDPDPQKPAHEVIFSNKKNEETHLSVFYNNIEVSCRDSQKHLCLVLHNKLTFEKH